MSIDCVKAGFLIKKKGIWILTPEGEEALKLGPVDFAILAAKSFRDLKVSIPLKTDKG